ncbi:MAG: hypothetical protein KDI71_15315 [Xanthomonadales bacterium]|nr:hypothetical protein [Xanthomonadales bacterium]
MNRFVQIFNLNSLVVTLLSIASTYLCLRLDIKADFPLTLVATAVIFPIVFSISGAYKRRETALANYGTLKSHGLALYYAARDWVPQVQPELVSRCVQLQAQLLSQIRDLFVADVSLMRQNEAPVYATFSEISLYIRDQLRANGMVANEVSRCNQYLSKMMVAFENTKHIYQYRTPRTLRAFSTVFIFLVPILYGPYFASEAAGYAAQVTYVMPALFSLVLVSLYNIQNHLENPFDGIGEDDVTINVEPFRARMSEQ